MVIQSRDSGMMTHPMETFEHTVSEDEAGRRLDRVLAEAVPGLSRTRIQALIQTGWLSVGGRTVTETSGRVKPAEHLVLRVPRAGPSALEAQAMPIEIVHEDEHLLVVDKPAGLVVHPGAGHADGTLVNALLAHCGESLSGIGGEARPGIVHRLDKDTSGLMMVAKTDEAHVRLSAALSARKVSRGYLAVVEGRPEPPSGEVEGAIGRHPRNRKKMAVVAAGGKQALTRYQTRRSWGLAASLVACSLATGRTHQIRVHMTAIGHPVLGDALYGRTRRRLKGAAEEAVAALGRQALHAATLAFHHPATNMLHEYRSEPPRDMRALIQALDEALS